MNVNADELLALWPLVFNFVRSRMQGESLAAVEDICGEAFMRAVEHYRELDGRENGLRNWLMTVAGRLVIDWRRREARVRFVGLDDVDAEQGRVGVGSDRHAAVLDLRAAIERVPERHRVALTAGADGYREVEIAALIGKSRKAVKAQRYRTHRALRAVLADQERGY